MAKTLSEVKTEMLASALERPLSEYVVYDRNAKVLGHSTAPFQHCYTDEADLTWALSEGGYEVAEHFTTDDGRQLTFIKAKVETANKYQSADGQYYVQSELPENGDDFVTEKYAARVRAERNARISDTDSYIQLPDMTVQSASKSAKRQALTDEEREEVLTYRQSLRDMPELEGFPYVDYPSAPSCIAAEVANKISQRDSMRMRGV